MPFVKVVKNKAYFKTYQVKLRRRREGRTDYRQRTKLVTQDKNKYNAHKYRLVVRFSNRFVLVQVIYSELNGDKVLVAAHSSELPKYGLKVGLKNYAAAYATGLLAARRLLNKLGLDEAYPGVEEPTGEILTTEENGRTYYVGELDEEKRPFRAFLDVGIKATTKGAKVFAAMKGAVDGGLDIPHNERRFPGYDNEKKALDADELRSRIMGAHVTEYMEEMLDDDEENFKKHFSKYIEVGFDDVDLEEEIAKTHEAIRENPVYEKKPAFTNIDKSFKKKGKDTLEQRKARVAAKKAAFAEQA